MTAVPGYPRFSGGFKKFRVTLSTNREKGTSSGKLVYSQGSRAKVVKFLWLKYLYDELTKEEWGLFYLLPEILDSELKVSALRAILLVGKKKVRKIFEESHIIPEEERTSRLQYQGYLASLDVEIYDFTRKLPIVPKFKGWIKSSSQKDRNSSKKSPSRLEPLAINENDYEDKVFDWYHYLTVGDFHSLPSG